MWHLIAHFDGKIYDLGACIFYKSMVPSLKAVYANHFGNDVKYRACLSAELDRTEKSQLDFIKDYKTKHFMNAQLETPDVAARFDDEG